MTRKISDVGTRMQSLLTDRGQRLSAQELRAVTGGGSGTYISYSVLYAGYKPSSGSSPAVNPYTRGCSAQTRCARG